MPCTGGTPDQRTKQYQDQNRPQSIHKDPEVTQYTASAHVIEADATVPVKKFCWQYQTGESGSRDEDPLKGVAEADLFRASWKDFDANDIEEYSFRG